MPRGKRAQQSAAPTPAPAVQILNAAPGYGAPAPAPSYPPVAPGSAAPAYGAPIAGSANGNVGFGPPPPRAPQEPFINAAFLWAYQRPIKAKIDGMRDATGTGNTDFQKQQRPGQPPRRAWFLDFTLEDGKKATGRINEGDMRHHRLWQRYQGNVVGQTVTLRLSNPGDIDPFTQKPTKAPWMIDPQ